MDSRPWLHLESCFRRAFNGRETIVQKRDNLHSRFRSVPFYGIKAIAQDILFQALHFVPFLWFYPISFR
ncbi:uncharacterized protein METZ01_LOCUS388014 [marine metagenome]|uniref:Uncharacterized protein n=1 Tax=marine metagenome TaxID=408172 RepID=A0A382ULT7_9ZZZZ